MLFLQSCTAEKCVGMAKFVISNSDELRNLRAVQVQTPILGKVVFTNIGSFLTMLLKFKFTLCISM